MLGNFEIGQKWNWFKNNQKVVGNIIVSYISVWYKIVLIKKNLSNNPATIKIKHWYNKFVGVIQK